MDNKRVIIAVILSMIVLFGWNLLFPPPEPPKKAEKPVAEETAAAPGEAASTDSGIATDDTQPFTPAQGRSITVATPLYHAVLNTDGGVLTSFRLTKYKETIKADAPDVDLIGPKAAKFQPLALVLGGKATWGDNNDKDLNLAAGEEGSLTFVGDLNGIRITRTMYFSGDTYFIKENTQINNGGQKRIKGDVGYTLAAEALSGVDDRYNQTRMASLSVAKGFEEETDPDDYKEAYPIQGGLSWGGLQSNYFMVALLPPSPAENTDKFDADFEDGVYRMVLKTPLGGIDPGQGKEFSFEYFLGPKEQSVLDAAPNNLARALDLGWFDFIAEPLLGFLRFLNTYVGNYGVAIIILTICIKIVLWPLSQKSYKSMDSMKKIQPMMAKIREKYKDDRQKMNEEMMNLYKTYKVNPAGGCLPMFLQIPVFIGLYQALLNTIELRHAPFITHVPFTDIVWLADLSAQDPFYITPIVMGATMFLQQKMTPPPGDPTQAKVMLLMPVVFTFMFLSFPSGLVVYWLVNNVISIAQQWWMLRNKA